MLQIQTLQQTQTSCFCCCWLCQTMGEPVRVDVDAVPADFRFKGVFRKMTVLGLKDCRAARLRKWQGTLPFPAESLSPIHFTPQQVIFLST